MIRAMRSLFLGTLAAVALGASLQAQAPAATTDLWEATIQRFEEADRAAPPMPGAVLFVGSSSIVRWATLEQDMAGVRVLNRGFGGSRISDVLRYADRVILPYRASHILVYAGDNDLSGGRRTADEVYADFAALVERIHAAQPAVPITWISIKPSPSRWDVADEMRRANAMVKALVDSDDRLHYLDVWTPMIGPDGMPPEELFVEDMLHMTPAGYEIWTAVVAPHVHALAGHAGH
jgi:lysophospholipase L1-like esterase